MVIHPRCTAFLGEISRYAETEDGTSGDDHLMDALRYAAEELRRGELFSFA